MSRPREERLLHALRAIAFEGEDGAARRDFEKWYQTTFRLGRQSVHDSVRDMKVRGWIHEKGERFFVAKEGQRELDANPIAELERRETDHSSVTS